MPKNQCKGRNSQFGRRTSFVSRCRIEDPAIHRLRKAWRDWRSNRLNYGHHGTIADFGFSIRLSAEGVTYAGELSKNIS